ncbi:MAG: HlyD family efflux transporter periplasmic adaptor subunit [Thermodesulfobacteriota bacterium]
MKKLHRAGWGVTVFLLFGLLGCGEKMAPGFAGSGTLEATEVNVSSLATGTVLEMTREEGQTVVAGDLLARIDVEKLTLQRAQVAAGLQEVAASRIAAEAAVAQARENFANTETRYKRTKELFAKGSATRQQFDDISTKLIVDRNQLAAAQSQGPLLDARQAQLEASLAVLDRQIADGTVTAPLAGEVVEKYVEPGEVVTAGEKIYKIADLKNFWLNIYLAETDLGAFPLGQAVTVRVDAVRTPLAGRITWTSPEAEFTPKNVQTRKARSELVYAVKVTLEENRPELKIGMPAEVYLVARN